MEVMASTFHCKSNLGTEKNTEETYHSRILHWKRCYYYSEVKGSNYKNELFLFCEGHYKGNSKDHWDPLLRWSLQDGTNTHDSLCSMRLKHFRRWFSIFYIVEPVVQCVNSRNVRRQKRCDPAKAVVDNNDQDFDKVHEYWRYWKREWHYNESTYTQGLVTEVYVSLCD